MLPVEHQRLVKYPLLITALLKETLGKHAEETTNEGDLEEGETDGEYYRKCFKRTKEILESIDRRVAEAMNLQRMHEIQRNLDTSGLEKMPDSPICAEYRVRGS